MSKDLQEGLGLGIIFALMVAVWSTDAVAHGERCIPSTTVDRVDIIDRQTLEFHMRNGQVYRNTLFGTLVGSTSDPLIFERGRPSVTQYCRMDSVGTFGWVASAVNPFTSSLGYFEPVEGFGELPEGIE